MGSDILLIEEYIDVKINKNLIEYYRDKGYDIQRVGVYKIKSTDLIETSNVKATFVCDYCGKIFKRSLIGYYRRKAKSLTDKDACLSCTSKKTKETNLLKYGVEAPLQNKDILQKTKETCIERYGVENPGQCKFVQEKMRKTSLERYGVENPMQCEEIAAKLCETIRTKYGEGCVHTSYIQRHLKELFECEINFQIGGCFADLYLDNEKVVIEYDGGGHDYAVKIGAITKEDFEKKDRKRENFFIFKGYKIIRIINTKDMQIDDSEYIRIKDKGIELLKNSKYSVYYYDVNTKVENYR